jgi:hypothetical protein
MIMNEMKIDRGVYVYRDPWTGVVRYVGGGTRNRMLAHARSPDLDLTDEFHTWMRGCGDIDWSEHREMVQEIDGSEAELREAESRWIAKHIDTVFNKCWADGHPIGGVWVKPRRYHQGSVATEVEASDGRRWQSRYICAAELGVTHNTVTAWCKQDGPARPRKGNKLTEPITLSFVDARNQAVSAS